jgi:hypothetical protein
VDLYNHGYFWEAHEAWEAVWMSWPREAPEALLVRGCIQTAAALLKLRLGVWGGVEKLSQRSLDTLNQSLSGGRRLLGLQPRLVVEELENFWSRPEIDSYPRLWPGEPRSPHPEDASGEAL